MPSALRIYAAGSNARGQLGSGHTDDQHAFFPAVFDDADALPDDAHALGLAAGANHTIVLLQRAGLDAEVWGCGDSARGQLLPAGSKHVFHALPLAVPARQGLAPAVVAASWETSFVIFAPRDPASTLSDVVVSFGANDFGDRGATDADRMGASVVDFGQVRAPELGINRPPELFRVREVVAGPHHVIARLDIWASLDSAPVCVLVGWGAGRHGQLGALPSILTPTPAPSKPLTAAPAKPLAATSPKPPTTSTNPPKKPRGPARRDPRTAITEPITIATYPPDADHPRQLAAGSHHTLILHSSGRITGLGSERRGQLDFPASLSSPGDGPRGVGCTWTTSFVVSGDVLPASEGGELRDWRVDACGSSNHGQLGRGPINTSPNLANQSTPEAKTTFGPVQFPQNITSAAPFRRMACGSEHVLVLAGDEVWAWGWNEHGNLGVGHTEDVLSPVCIWPNQRHSSASEEGKIGAGRVKVLDIWAGCGTSWLLVEEELLEE